MRLTFLGHVGFYIETRGGSVLCDPWFTPAYFGSWFPFPRNDDLDPTLYARPVDKHARVILPPFHVPFLERELRSLGFEHFIRSTSHEPVDLGDGLTAT